jgi:chromosome segregation ATPase
MTRANKALVVLVVAVLGLWGCAQGSAGSSAANLERIKALEGKCSKLEDDYRAVASARDQMRKKLASAEEERARVQQELNVKVGIAKERDDLRVQLQSRTAERDSTQTQFEQFRKNLKTLLGQAEAANGTATGGAAVSAAHTAAGQS